MFIKLSYRGVQEISYKLAPSRLSPLLAGVGRPLVLLPVLGHDVLAVHGVVEPVPSVDVTRQVFKFVPVRRQETLKWVSDHHKSERILGKSESRFITNMHGKTQMNDILKCHLQWFRKNATSTV